VGFTFAPLRKVRSGKSPSLGTLHQLDALHGLSQIGKHDAQRRRHPD